MSLILLDSSPREETSPVFPNKNRKLPLNKSPLTRSPLDFNACANPLANSPRDSSSPIVSVQFFILNCTIAAPPPHGILGTTPRISRCAALTGKPPRWNSTTPLPQKIPTTPSALRSVLRPRNDTTPRRHTAHLRCPTLRACGDRRTLEAFTDRPLVVRRRFGQRPSKLSVGFPHEVRLSDSPPR